VIVVDATAIIAFFLREEDWLKLSEYMSTTISLDHVIKEFYNAVWKALHLRKVVSINEAMRIIQLFKEYLERNMILEDERNYMDSAFKIAVESKLTVYDSLYIALAQSIHKPLLSLDEKQRTVAQKYDVEVLP